MQQGLQQFSHGTLHKDIHTDIKETGIVLSCLELNGPAGVFLSDFHDVFIYLYIYLFVYLFIYLYIYIHIYMMAVF